MKMLTHEVDELVGVLDRGRHPHRSRPIKVHVSQLVSQLLNIVRTKFGNAIVFLFPDLAHHYEVSWAYRALIYRLRDEEKILVLIPGYCVIDNGSRRRILVFLLQRTYNFNAYLKKLQFN